MDYDNWLSSPYTDAPDDEYTSLEEALEDYEKLCKDEGVDYYPEIAERIWYETEEITGQEIFDKLVE